MSNKNWDDYYNDLEDQDLEDYDNFISDEQEEENDPPEF